MKGGRFFNPRVASHRFRSFQSPSTSILLDDSVHNSDPTAVSSLFNSKIPPPFLTYGLTITFCPQKNRLNLEFSFLAQLFRAGRRMEAVNFNPILRALCSENRFGQAVAIVIDKLPKLGCIPDVLTCTVLIHELCKKGEIEKAEKVLHSMISKELKPNVAICHTLIDGLLKTGEIYKAKELLFDIIFPRNRPKGGTYKEDEIDKPTEVPDNMISKGLEPNVVTYSALIDGLCMKGETAKAEEVLRGMISKGLEPNVVAYNTLIDRLCKKGEIEKAEEVLHSMISKELKPNVVTYNSFIDGLCKKGEIEKAEEVLHSLISKGLEPNLFTYDLLIVGMVKIGEIDKAKKFMFDLISIWVDHNRNSMISKGLDPNELAYDALIDTVFKVDKAN